MNKEQAQILSDVLAKLIVKQQQMVDLLTPTWQKTLAAYTPLIASLLAGAASVFVAYKTFTWNRNKERNTKFNETLINLYGEFMECSTDYLNTFEKMNLIRLDMLYNTIQDIFYKMPIHFTLNQDDINYAEEAKKLFIKFEAKEAEYITAYKKLFTVVTKIDFHLPDSGILDKFDLVGKNYSLVVFDAVFEQYKLTEMKTAIDMGIKYSSNRAIVPQRVSVLSRSLDKIGDELKAKKR